MAKAKKTKKSRLKMGAKDAKKWADKPAPGGQSRPSLDLPSGIKLYSPKKGKARLSIILFEAGEGNPAFEKGEPAYERTYFVHRVGIKSESHICLQETFEEKCPICEERNRLFRGDAEDIEAAKTLGAKIRQMWLVYDHDNPKDGVQLMELSYHAFGKQLREFLDEEDDDAFAFADPDDGSIIEVKWKEESFGGGSFVSAGNIALKSRKPLSDKITSQAICLDDLLKKTEYEALRDIYLQGASDADEDDDEDDDDDDDLDDDDDDEEPKKKGKGKDKKGKGKKKPDPDEEDDDDDDEDDDDDDDDDDDEDDESDGDDEDEDDDDDDEDDDDDDEDEDDDDDDDDDDEDDDDEDDDEEEEPPKKSKKGKGKKPDPKKGKGKKGKRK